MEIDELLKLLDMDSPSDMRFFEQFADLVETEAEIQQETLTTFFEDVERDSLHELTEGYFEDVLKYIPDDATEFYTLLSTIGRLLGGLAAAIETEGNRQLYAEEFYKFRSWFMFDGDVICVRESDGEELALSIFDALTLFRSENLSDDEYSYDFSETLDYTIDEIMIPLSSLGDDEYDDDEDDSYDDEDEG